MRKTEIQEIAEHCWNVLCNWYDMPKELPMPDYYVSSVARFAKYMVGDSRIRVVIKTNGWKTYDRKRVGEDCTKYPI